MAMTTRRDAEAFARLLDGPRTADTADTAANADGGELATLATLARSIPRPQVGPDPAFVARLRDQLVTTAHERAERRPASASPSSRATPTAPRTLVVRWPKGLVPVTLATVLGLVVLVAGLASRALPGDRLYDVKLGIGQAQVRMAGSDLARGKALLRQVDHRLDEVDSLVAAGDPSSADVNVALNQAAVDLARAQRVLLSSANGHPDPDALQSLADATAQASGRLRALAPLVPTASGPALHRLQDLLAVGNAALQREAQACGSACDDVRRQIEAIAGTTSGTPPAGSGSGSGDGATNPATQGSKPSSRPGVSVPTVAPSAPAGGGGGAGGSQPGASAPGVTASVPGVGVTVPGVSVTTAPDGRPSVSVPPVVVTLGPVTASVSTSGCVIGLGGLCVGLPTE
ncbi:DUF5667 domain-containing protein [Angustibacter luteus]|uniref:DUF5667 domain-containing protein n=1 Tax=Angustibacter luteus TaxID=658456 RepID=A0ABW1JEL2_9ACTN